MIPFLINIIFHPESEKARKIAHSIHEKLSDDPAIPGLRIPTRYVPEDGTTLPPASFDPLKEAERVFIIVLVDKIMKAGYEEDKPGDRLDWGPWIVKLYNKCEGQQNFRCVPFEIEQGVHPLDPDLADVNYPRAWLIEEDERAAWINSRIVIELLRFFANLGSKFEDNPKPPLKVFLSHTKIDINNEPRLQRNS